MNHGVFRPVKKWERQNSQAAVPPGWIRHLGAADETRV